jgi:hypothetical protein
MPIELVWPLVVIYSIQALVGKWLKGALRAHHEPIALDLGPEKKAPYDEPICPA